MLYEKYPSMESLEFYYRFYGSQFPLYKYGRLNVKELAEIIKHLYQFRTNKEFNILTIGSMEDYEAIKPHVHFVVGNEKTLADYKSFDGTFSYAKHLNYALSSNKKQSLISLDLENLGKYGKISETIDLTCITKDPTIFSIENCRPFNRDKTEYGYINFVDETQLLSQTNATRMSSSKQIFSYSIARTRLHGNKKRSIRDVLDFSIHQNDTFIAKVLISIIIYKRNNNIEELTAEDYNHIFDVLFKEKVAIKEEAEKDFPRILRHVP